MSFDSLLQKFVSPLNNNQIQEFLDKLRIDQTNIDKLVKNQHIIPAWKIIKYIQTNFENDRTRIYELIGFMIKHQKVVLNQGGIACLYEWLDECRKPMDILYELFDPIYQKTRDNCTLSNTDYYFLNVILKLVKRDAKSSCYHPTILNEDMIQKLLKN